MKTALPLLLLSAASLALSSCSVTRDWMKDPEPIASDLSLRDTREILEKTVRELGWQIDALSDNRFVVHRIVTADFETRLSIEFDVGVVRMRRLDTTWVDEHQPQTVGRANTPPREQPQYVKLADDLWKEIDRRLRNETEKMKSR